jgi:cyclin-dependent kinase 7
VHSPSTIAHDLTEQLNEAEKAKYVKVRKVGEGTYANVYLGHLVSNPASLVAIKKIKVQADYKEGLAPDAVRELKFLQELSHPNIISLLSVYSSKDQNLNLVLEYLPLGDLEGMIKDHNIVYGNADIKSWMGMLSRAVYFCHANFVLHRDIKPNNLLIASDGSLKLADFGLARSYANPGRPMSTNVITTWYRPPELFFGAKHYAGAVDIWSVGMVFAELIIRAPYIWANSEIEQIAKICETLGTPTEENWPGVTKLPKYIVHEPTRPLISREEWMMRLGSVGNEGVDLLIEMLTFDPRRRITAEGVLSHKWWSLEPRPTDLAELPRKREGGQEAMGEDLKRRPGVLDEESGTKVARKLDFGVMK